jgi:hypothetical protein
MSIVKFIYQRCFGKIFAVSSGSWQNTFASAATSVAPATTPTFMTSEFQELHLSAT